MHASDEPIMELDVATADVNVTHMQKNFKCSFSELNESKYKPLFNYSLLLPCSKIKIQFCHKTAGTAGKTPIWGHGNECVSYA
jgi:hypothetical protein